MKKYFLLFSCVVGAIILMASTNESNSTNVASLKGVWELEHQFLFENNQVTDTIFNMNGYRQVKMYSKGQVMWTRYSPIDNNEWFGYGTYKVEDGMLEERLEYASESMMSIVDTVQVFRFELQMEKNSYSQISLDADGNRYLSENYKRIEK